MFFQSFPYLPKSKSSDDTAMFKTEGRAKIAFKDLLTKLGTI